MNDRRDSVHRALLSGGNEDLNALRVGVRADQEGEIIQDFHMVHKDEKTSYLTRRYYLSDAVFVVGVESEDDAVLQKLVDAVKNPVFPLFLGRCSCPPCGPIVLGIREFDLETALDKEPWQIPEWRRKRECTGRKLQTRLSRRRHNTTFTGADMASRHGPPV